MKQSYENTVLTITRFLDEDVITTSTDTNNAYQSLSDLNDSDERVVPNR